MWERTQLMLHATMPTRSCEDGAAIGQLRSMLITHQMTSYSLVSRSRIRWLLGCMHRCAEGFWGACVRPAHLHCRNVWQLHAVSCAIRSCCYEVAL
jgi:hypothetical protein